MTAIPLARPSVLCAAPPVFGPTVAGYYWSATTGATSPNGAWRVYFYSGGVDNAFKHGTAYVRAVRAGL